MRIKASQPHYEIKSPQLVIVPGQWVEANEYDVEIEEVGSDEEMLWELYTPGAH